MKKIIYSLSLLLAFVCVSCKEEVQLVNMDFSSELEQPVSSDSTKNYLSMEQYVYWNEGDKVFVFAGESNDFNDSRYGREVFAAPKVDNPQFADISAPELAYVDRYYGIYPSSCADATKGPKTINMPTQYQYTRTGNIDPDLTFPAPGIPMVAYQKIGENSHSELPHLDFHSVVGVARIEIANNTSEDKAVTKVKFSDLTGYSDQPVTPISGKFTVNNIEKYDPYLTYSETSSTGTSSTPTSIEINTFGSSSPLASGKIMTIYLPLPATTSNQGTSSSQPNYKDYYLKMEVYNGDNKIFAKAFQVKIRRNTLSYLPAIVVTDWSTPTSNVQLVGHGTQLRPFQIYNEDDMLKVKAAFDMTTPTINGQQINNNTYFRVVRSDITLSAAKWNGGIKNFKGHFTYSSGAASDAGITNNGSAPIFESIYTGAQVEGINVKGSATANTNPFSPLCYTNNGTISDCHFLGSLSSSSQNLAGICAINGATGKLTNCSNRGTITATATGSKAAGICFTNNGEISAFTISSSNITAQASVAGICYENNKDVKNSQVNLSYGSQASPITWSFGGLVYENGINGKIENCEVLGSLFTTQEFGGICHTNKGIVDACRVGITFVRGATINDNQYVGGVAARQSTNNSAEIRNCFNSSSSSANLQASQGYCGGIVGFITSGYVKNCFTNFEVAYNNLNKYGMIAGYIATPSGNTIQNCYNGRDVAPFYAYSTIPQNQISTNCFNPETYSPHQAYCSRYNLQSGNVTYEPGVTTPSGTLSEKLNAWVTSNGSSTYLSWTTGVTPRFQPTTKNKR